MTVPLSNPSKFIIRPQFPLRPAADVAVKKTATQNSLIKFGTVAGFPLWKSTHKIFAGMKDPLSIEAVQTARVLRRKNVTTCSPAFDPAHYRSSNYKEFPMPRVCTANETSLYICSAL